MQFHEKKFTEFSWKILKNKFCEIDFFDFTSFFRLDFFKFSGPLCVVEMH